MQLVALLFVLHAGEFDRYGTLVTKKLSACYANAPVLILIRNIFKEIPVQFLLGKSAFERNNHTWPDFAHQPKFILNKSL